MFDKNTGWGNSERWNLGKDRKKEIEDRGYMSTSRMKEYAKQFLGLSQQEVDSMGWDELYKKLQPRVKDFASLLQESGGDLGPQHGLNKLLHGGDAASAR